MNGRSIQVDRGCLLLVHSIDRECTDSSVLYSRTDVMHRFGHMNEIDGRGRRSLGMNEFMLLTCDPF